MAEQKTNVDFNVLDGMSSIKRALIIGSESFAQDDTVTLDNEEYKVNSIVSVFAHEKATGASVQYSYADNVLTKESATGSEDVIEILFN